MSVDEVRTNCVWSENSISSCSTVTALLRIATLVCEAATSIGSLSITDKTVSGKKLKNSAALDKTTLSSAKNPSLFLKKRRY